MRIRPLKKPRALSDFENLEPGQEKFGFSDILGRNTNLIKTSMLSTNNPFSATIFFMSGKGVQHDNIYDRGVQSI